MRLLATLLLAAMLGSSIGCSWGRGCGCGTSYYGGSSCPGGNCGIQQGAFNTGGYGGLQSAAIPGTFNTAAAPVYYGQPVTTTATAPVVVNQTAAAPLPTYGN